MVQLVYLKFHEFSIVDLTDEVLVHIFNVVLVEAAVIALLAIQVLLVEIKGRGDFAVLGEGTEGHRENVQAIAVFVRIPVLHLVQLLLALLVIFQRVYYVVFLHRMGVRLFVHAMGVQEVLEVIALPDLTWDSQSLVVSSPCLIIVVLSLLYCAKKFGVQ